MARRYRVRRRGVLWSIEREPSWFGRLLGTEQWHEYGAHTDWHDAMVEACALFDHDRGWHLAPAIRKHGPHVGWRHRPDLSREYAYYGLDHRPYSVVPKYSDEDIEQAELEYEEG